jgi:TPR repeat protein
MKKILLPLLTTYLLATPTNMEIALGKLNSGDYDKAIQLLKQEKENAQVDLLLGKAYFKRHLTYTDYQFALKYFQKAGNLQAKYYLGLLYEKGLGVKQNITKAIRYLEESKTPEADYTLANLYLNGKYVLKNPHKAISLLQDSAKAGYSKAQLLLGKLYLKGVSIIDKDWNEAAKWIYLSAKNGSLEAKKLWDKNKLYRFLRDESKN